MPRLTMTHGLRQSYRRQARSRFDRHEAQLRAAMSDALDAWFARLRQRVSMLSTITAAAPLPAPSGGGGSTPPGILDALLGGDPQPFLDVIDSMGPYWGNVVDDRVMPKYRAIMNEVLAAGLDDARIADDLTKWRGDWLDARRQEIVNVSDSITGIMRTGLKYIAQSGGTSTSDAYTMAQALLSSHNPSWLAKAQLIARTETVSANNQGALTQASAYAAAGSIPASKTWLATEDDKTRPDHADIDGTTIDIHDTFTVGDSVMNGPGDNRGGPEQVCNCRCTMTYAYGEDAVTAAAGPSPSPQQQPSQRADSADDTPSGVAIMLGLGASDEASLLALPDVPEPDAPGLHCTLGYLDGDASSYSDEQKAALLSELAKLGEHGLVVTADAFATAHFNPDDDEREPCAVLLVQSAALAELHDQVGAAISAAGLLQSETFPIWIPHVAVAYGADPSIIPDSALGEVQFDRLVVGWGGEQIVVVGDGASDTAEDTGDDALTAATEEPVTAPAVTPPAATTPSEPTTAIPENPEPQGVTWSGPIALLDVPSSDGRMIASAGLVFRTLPLPLSWQRESAPEHDGKVTVGRVLEVHVEGGTLMGSGDFLDPMITFDAEQAMALVQAGMGLVSVDLAVLEGGWAAVDGTPIDPVLWDGDPDDVVEVALASEFGGVTIIDFPAFDGVRIALDDTADSDAVQETGEILMPPAGVGAFAAETETSPTISDDGTSVVMPDGSTVSVGDPVSFPDGTDGEGGTLDGTISSVNADDGTVSITPAVDDQGQQPPDVDVPVEQLQSATDAPPSTEVGQESLIAAAEVRPYRARYFARDEPGEPTPLTVNPETGEVYGHVAEWGSCHIGKLAESGQCVTPPRSSSEYGYFNLTPIPTDDGGSVNVGRITIGTGHAGPRLGMSETLAHYDNSGTVAALVHVKDGEHGPWACGQLVHDLPAAKIEELMRTPLSGDWRTVRPGGGLELVAALGVNVPGFPIRPVVGRSKSVGQLSLVASGVVQRADSRGHSKIMLPSGRSIASEDFESLVAGMLEVVSRDGGVGTLPKREERRAALSVARRRLAAQQDAQVHELRLRAARQRLAGVS